MVAILQFLGTNCEYDMEYAFSLLNAPTQIVWHKETSLPQGTKLVVIPGGFSYGDYLRSGAIARFSPIMKAVIDFAKQGGYVLGVFWEVSDSIGVCCSCRFSSKIALGKVCFGVSEEVCGLEVSAEVSGIPGFYHGTERDGISVFRGAGLRLSDQAGGR